MNTNNDITSELVRCTRERDLARAHYAELVDKYLALQVELHEFKFVRAAAERAISDDLRAQIDGLQQKVAELQKLPPGTYMIAVDPGMYSFREAVDEIEKARELTERALVAGEGLAEELEKVRQQHLVLVGDYASLSAARSADQQSLKDALAELEETRADRDRWKKHAEHETQTLIAIHNQLDVAYVKTDPDHRVRVRDVIYQRDSWQGQCGEARKERDQMRQERDQSRQERAAEQAISRVDRSAEWIAEIATALGYGSQPSGYTRQSLVADIQAMIDRAAGPENRWLLPSWRNACIEADKYKNALSAIENRLSHAIDGLSSARDYVESSRGVAERKEAD